MLNTQMAVSSEPLSNDCPYRQDFSPAGSHPCLPPCPGDHFWFWFWVGTPTTWSQRSSQSRYLGLWISLHCESGGLVLASCNIHSLFQIKTLQTPHLGFPGDTVLKNLPASARNTVSIPGSGKSPGVGNGHPLQYFCLVNCMDRGAWLTTVHGVSKNLTQLNHWAGTQTTLWWHEAV